MGLSLEPQIPRTGGDHVESDEFNREPSSNPHLSKQTAPSHSVPFFAEGANLIQDIYRETWSLCNCISTWYFLRKWLIALFLFIS